MAFIKKLIAKILVHQNDERKPIHLKSRSSHKASDYEPHINSWDCLAAIVIVAAAGGRCNDFLANDGMTDGNPILAAGKPLYPLLLLATGKDVR